MNADQTSSLDRLTIADARALIVQGKEIEKFLAGQLSTAAPATVCTSVAASLIGKYVVVRCQAAGVHAGVLENTDGRACLLSDARRLWRWRVPNGAPDFLSGVATHGLADDCKIGAPIRVALTENCEIIECTAAAEKSIRGFATCTRTQ